VPGNLGTIFADNLIFTLGRRLDLNIPPSTFGKDSAYIAFDILEGKKVDNRIVSTKSLIYNYENIKSLKLKIPEDCHANFSAPD